MNPASGLCQLATYLDGIRVMDFDLDSLNPTNIEAFEVFHGVGETPIEYAHNCGVILLWLKH